ncbi:MAG: 7-cyano-7-deazaguanine synthase QueC [Candidatus Aminicenantales bacterium]
MKKKVLSFIISEYPFIMKKSVVLFSGGLDSTTALYWALHLYEKVFALTFDYGQRHRIEVHMAKKHAQKLGVSHRILKVDLNQIGGSALTDSHLPLPEYERTEEIKERPPSTYVPFRNGIFLSLAAAWAEVEGVKDIICGFNIIDSPDYPDTRKDFVKAMELAINTGTKASFSQEKFRILSPFVDMKKADIIRKGIELGADFSLSISCYRGEEIPCQKCSTCLLREKAFQEAGMADPLIERLKEEGKI